MKKATALPQLKTMQLDAFLTLHTSVPNSEITLQPSKEIVAFGFPLSANDRYETKLWKRGFSRRKRAAQSLPHTELASNPPPPEHTHVENEY